jgi:hypothetical protein
LLKVPDYSFKAPKAACVHTKGFVLYQDSTIFYRHYKRIFSYILFETRRVQNKLLYEPKSSGNMVFHPLGLYFIDFWFNSKHKLNYHNLNQEVKYAYG